LILVGAGPFEDKYTIGLMNTRLDRLHQKDKREVIELVTKMNEPGFSLERDIFQRFGEIMTKCDSYKLLNEENENLDYQPEIFQAIIGEAMELRSSGELLRKLVKINCPIVFIHGDYDPHPAEGITEPLEKVKKDHRFYLLEKCGHYPWREKYAREEFYRIIKEEIKL
jgi:pimeloyl-ACP methyl ester carboxylesterase